MSVCKNVWAKVFITACGAKYALSVIGRARNEMRLPLTPIGDAAESGLRRAMMHAGILNA